MSPIINPLTRDTVVESHTDKGHFAIRTVPAEQFEPYLEPGETLTDVTPEDLEARLKQSFQPYTEEGDTLRPAIEVVPFRVDAVAPDEVFVRADWLAGDVIELKPFIGWRSYFEAKGEPEPLPEPPVQYAEALRSLNTVMLDKTVELSKVPGALLWYEGRPSQYMLILPGGEATLNGRPKMGGPAGTFMRIELDPSVVRVETEASDRFTDDLTSHLCVLANEAERLFGFEDSVAQLLSSEHFNQLSPVANMILQAALVAA